ncbi:magnesium transporter MRS2-B-like isoform X1 [Triticum dicoccoides]|uniref:magnesium transporter MRS2-B-like isoform X1 n=1 Tax=Triticum dicoccoides TaxID=85692 RepID=UPI00188E9D6B|nr:magnesium transporter MRS2-B-like isoform X1 [Triticum dicoccoides]
MAEKVEGGTASAGRSSASSSAVRLSPPLAALSASPPLLASPSPLMILLVGGSAAQGILDVPNLKKCGGGRSAWGRRAQLDREGLCSLRADARGQQRHHDVQLRAAHPCPQPLRPTLGVSSKILSRERIIVVNSKLIRCVKRSRTPGAGANGEFENECERIPQLLPRGSSFEHDSFSSWSVARMELIAGLERKRSSNSLGSEKIRSNSSLEKERYISRGQQRRAKSAG